MIDHVQQKIVFLLCRFVVMPSYEINSTTLLRVGEWENPREHNQTRARGVSPGGEAGRIGYPRREAIVGLVCVTTAYRASGSIDIHVDRFGLDLIHSPSSVGVFEAEMAV